MINTLLKNSYRYAKNVSALLFVIVLLFQLREYVASSSTSVMAEVTYGDFELPRGLLDTLKFVYTSSDLDTLKAKLNVETILSSIKDSTSRRGTGLDILFEVQEFLRSRLPFGIPQPYSTITGYWGVTVINDGDNALQSVSIILPNTCYATIIKESGQITSGPSASQIELGTMRPTESISIFAWCDWVPDYSTGKRIKLSHSAGVGHVKVLQPTSAFGHWISEEPFMPLYFGFIAICLIGSIGFAIGWYLSLNQTKRREL